MISQVTLGDCMEGVKQYPDKYFDLAVVDPPYGLADRLVKGGAKGSMGSLRKLADDKVEKWDIIPTGEYFNELFRVSKEQIIWGGNYFLDYLGSTDGFIVWDKMNGTNPMSDAELAWKSAKGTTRIFRMHHFSKGYEGKIHPTQKPVKLYDWIYKNYLPNGGKVLDTHGGSMSNLISAIKQGNIEMTVFEIDKDYFLEAKKRVQNFLLQGNMFTECHEVKFIE